MNWKGLFFLSMGVWIVTFALTNCSPSEAKAIKELAESSRIIHCDDPYDPDCLEILRQIDGYKNLITFNEVDFENTEPIAPDPLKYNYGDQSVPVNAGDDDVVGNGLVKRSEIAAELSDLQGFRYKAEELLSIASYAASKKGDGFVYAMLAINNDKSSVKSRGDEKIKYMDIYFQAKTKKGGKPILYKRYDGSKFDEYGDFPKPCPHFCP